MADALVPLNRLRAGLVLAAAAFLLAACGSFSSSLDELAGTTPTGSPFTQQLFKNYAYLANSFGGTAGGSSSFASEDTISIFDDGDSSTLAEAFATKALIAARGTEPDPEPSTDGDSASARDRLLRALADGKDRFPSDAARAQTDYDCWMLNAAVASQAAAAAQCRASFDRSIDALEHDGHRPVYAPPPMATAPAPAADYTVYFDFDSWTLSGEQLTVLQQAIDAARRGQQSRIAIVGHTDTSGSALYNRGLSVRRANVVKDVLVQMGARPESISTEGVGENDLAVPTPDGVREPKNRRAVVTLMP
ncbi:MAG TPA: OmpA family protein [Rhizomicrobium sp.]|jgi:outer membrane protein OmpA-like peptidoglycan-associated protein|nr:OmpA family protein [Rhizomicrobium sp.]